LKLQYEVCLTWLEGDEALQENLDVVRKRCVFTTTRLLASVRYSDYKAVFDEWVTDKVIEVAP
jgi:hypothetical protein